MKPADFISIGQSIRRLSECDAGRTSLNNALADLADEIAGICKKEVNFDHTKFMDACGLKVLTD